MDIIKLLILNSDGLAFAITATTLIYSILSSRYTNSREIIKEQHEKLISPIFFVIEPYLFQSIDGNSLEKVFYLIDQNKSLVDGKLLEIAYFCKKNPSQANYNALCSYINKSYDKSCRRLGLKSRSIEYRLSRKQYENNFSLFAYFGFIFIKGFLTIGIALLLFLFLIGFGSLLFDKIKTPKNELLSLIIIVFLMLAVLRYLDS